MLTYSTVFYCGNEGKSMKVRNSITSKDEKLTDVQLQDQWNKTDWKKAEEHVNRIQVRITKAVKAGKWYLVKRLQYLISHSYYAKLLATRKPTQNTGKRTAGVDGETWLSSKTKMEAALRLTDKKYVAKPLKRVFIEKPGKKKKRPLGIPTMYDRAMQSLYALALEPIAEATGDRTSFGFRKFRSTHDACEQVFVCMRGKHSPEWVLEGDIKGCFDNISHQWLIDNIPLDKSVLRQFLKAGFIFEHKLFQTEAGTPQGGIISPILANITLDGIEKLLADKYRNNKNGNRYSEHAAKHKVNYVRYADDFIVTAKTEEIAKELIADRYWHSEGNRKWVFSEGDKKLKLLSDTKIVRHTRLKLDMNPYLDKDYFIERKIKQGVKKLKSFAKSVWGKVKNVTKPETKTMTNNCCPN